MRESVFERERVRVFVCDCVFVCVGGGISFAYCKYVCMYVYMYVYTRTYLYIYVYIYTYLYTIFMVPIQIRTNSHFPGLTIAYDTYTYIYINAYGVATVSTIDQIIRIFCRILSLLQGSFAKETYNLIDLTNQSHPIHVYFPDHHANPTVLISHSHIARVYT